MRITQFLLIGLILIGFSPSLHASHILGGELWYEVDSACTYKVYTDIYYDCSSLAASAYIPLSTSNVFPFVNDPEIRGIAGSLCSTLQISPSASTTLFKADVTPLCPTLDSIPPGPTYPTVCDNTTGNALYSGIMVVRTEYEFDLCGYACTSFEVVWQECCYSPAITNIVNASTASSSLGFSLIDLNLPGQNASPIYNTGGSSPTRDFYMCVGESKVMDFSATDPDGDSLSYALATSVGYYNGGVATPVNYVPGYSANEPLGPNWVVDLDPVTGLMTISPNAGGSLELAIVSVEVTEWRNGVAISTNQRDAQITVLPCGGNAPQFTGMQALVNGTQTGPSSIATYVGDTLSFSLTFTDADTLDSLSVFVDPLGPFPGADMTITGSNPLNLDVSIPMNNLAYGGQTFSLLFAVSDQSCPFSSQDYVWVNLEVAEIALSDSITESACGGSTGEIDLTVMGGVAPYAYLWSNGSTSEDLTGLPSGFYDVLVTDSNGDSVQATYFVPAGDLQLDLLVQAPDCDSSNGSIDLTVTGGNPPLSFLWSTGDTTEDVDSLVAGGYNVMVEDDSACTNFAVVLVEEEDSCTATLSGYAYIDANGNCERDSGEIPIPNLFIDLIPGGAVLTDSNGYYAFDVPVGVYDLVANTPTAALPNCLGSIGHTVVVPNTSADSSGLDFAFDANPLYEMVASHFSSGPPPFPGQSHPYYLFARNEGSLPASGTVSLEFDPAQLQSVFGFPTPDSTGPGFLQWDFQAASFSGKFFYVVAVADTNLMLNDTLTTYMTILPLGNDIDTTNNRDTLKLIVSNSYDPNDKAVLPAGEGPLGLIDPTEVAHEYTIRFQNTGNAPAQTVLIRDTLDAHLMPASIRILGSSHALSTRFQDDSILIFLFENINLADAASDSLGSIGFVSFEMDHQAGLPLGTEITNRAGIYFDYNPPIITNTVLNTLYLYPELSLLLEGETVCAGDELVGEIVNGLPPFTYTWNAMVPVSSMANRDTLTVGQSGWYTLQMEDVIGEIVEDSVLVTVTELPEAVFLYNILSDSNDFLVEFVNVSSGADSVRWDFGDGTSSTVFAPTHQFADTGEFTVSLTVINACGEQTETQLIGIVSSLDVWRNSLSLRPNPAQESVELRLTNLPPNGYTLSLQDLAGRTIWPAERHNEQVLTLARKGLPAGVYLLHIQSEDGNATLKLVWE